MGDLKNRLRSFLSVAVAGGLAYALSGCAVSAAAADAADYDGAWAGTWATTDGATSGPLAMTIDHFGAQLLGSASIGGTLCIGDGRVDGDVDNAGEMRVTIDNGLGGRVDLDGDVQRDDLVGTFVVSSGLCFGSTGHFTLAR